RMRINPQLISKFTGLICTGESFDDDLGDNEVFKEIDREYGYKKGGYAFDISKINNL
ncbi:hypothetical protein KI387_016065, partial [Taxus chinensis]